MLDEANSEFINTAVTVLRYGVYLWLGVGALALAIWLLAWLWGLFAKLIEIVGRAVRAVMPRFLWRSDVDEARQRMRDLGY